MASYSYLFLLGYILFIHVLLLNTLPLDSDCTMDSQCDGMGSMLCRNGRCECDVPWYEPCGTFCEPRRYFAYEGQECRVDENCVVNSWCDKSTKRCRCIDNCLPLNGLCYRSLNTTCSKSSDCWSNECRDGVCKCPLGFVPRDVSRCQRRYARIYPNWNEANRSNDFCYGIGSEGCLDPYAICQNDSQRPEKFCQCPPGFNGDYSRQECQSRAYSGALSPSTTQLPYDVCNFCSDENAVCARVDNQTTCWCRSGYIKVNDRCEVARSISIFPNDADIREHQYSSPNCSVIGNNGSVVPFNSLCVCAPGYEFVGKTTSCQQIKRTWDTYFEYGVCTRIDSSGIARQESGLCPPPLRCEARQDKYVCSCGGDKYLDEDNNKCYHYLERNLTNPDSSACPPNSKLVESRYCQCLLDGAYLMTSDRRRCELKLSTIPTGPDCANNVTNDSPCIDLFGDNTKFCKLGECRCDYNRSFYENGRCVTYLNVNPGPKGVCPQNASNMGGLCKCRDGYRENPSNRTCEPKVDILYDSTSFPSSSSYSDVRKQDCKELFMNGPVEVYNNACVCENGSYSNGSTCVFYLMHSISLSGGTIPYCPLYSSTGSVNRCQCDAGYVNRGDNRTCDPITNMVYEHNDVSGINTTGVTRNGCRRLFGYAAEVSASNTFCRCSSPTVAFWDRNRCYFLVETPQNDLVSFRDCPVGSLPVENTCKCPIGYQAISSKRGCERKPIYSSYLQSIDTRISNIRCSDSFNDDDCVALHGDGAVCRNDTCYCDQSRSFVRGIRCVLFSNLVFPGMHERSTYTCNVNDDCGIDSQQKGIECGYLNENQKNYKVCKCRAGYYLNPIDSTCVRERCQSICTDTEECQGYKCVCKRGHYRNSTGQCVPVEATFRIHDKCNSTFWSTFTPFDNDLQCSSRCERIQCNSSYRNDGSRCVKLNYNDYCSQGENNCTEYSVYAECNREENRCTCRPGYYETGGKMICARAVNTLCEDDVECGELARCLNKRCKCKQGVREQQITDAYGRSIIRCGNGIPVQIRVNSILLFLLTLIHKLI